MTQDEVIEMAREAGFKMENSAAMQAAKAFYKLATAKEREACAQICEEYSNSTDPHKDYEDYDDGWVDACYACKLAVTSRGEA